MLCFPLKNVVHVFLSLKIDLVLVNSAESNEKVSEHDQEIPKSQTADQPMAL